MPSVGEGTKSPVCLRSYKASHLDEDALSALSPAFYPTVKLSKWHMRLKFISVVQVSWPPQTCNQSYGVILTKPLYSGYVFK